MHKVAEKKSVTFGNEPEAEEVETAPEPDCDTPSPSELSTPEPPDPTENRMQSSRRGRLAASESNLDESRGKPATRGSSSQDPSIVLTYLKRNNYDDTGEWSLENEPTPGFEEKMSYLLHALCTHRTARQSSRQ